MYASKEANSHFVGKNIALVLFDDVPEPSNFKRHYARISTNAYAIAWAILICMNGVLLGPWDIDKGGSRFYCVLRFFAVEPIIIRDSSFAP